MMSSILSAFKFRSSDDSKVSKAPELENSSSALKPVDASAPVTGTEASGEKKKPSPCCCCKETKLKRDECIMINGEENCSDLIEAHRICMKGFGYEV